MQEDSTERRQDASDRIGRRDFVKVGVAGALGLAFPDWLAPRARGEAGTGKARSVIQLWMAGGPCHIDTWDPKPQAGPEYTGPYRKPIATNVEGIQISQMLPMMAKQMDKIALLRGMTHSSNAHEIGTYVMQTGTPPAEDLVYPSIGAVVALKKTESGEYKGALPPYIAVTRPLGRFSESGFLGSNFKVFATGGDPNARGFSIGGLGAGKEAASKTLKRKELLASFDGFARKLDQDPALRDMDRNQQKAYSLILGDAREAFDLSKEDDKVRDRYGRTNFGQSCLLARRLVEKGVPFITINWGGWDTHKQHFEKMNEFLPNLDRAFSALIEDLARRGLLETTIVTWSGEFGRTPRVANEPPWQGGRHHFGNAFSAVVAGGGFQGGQVVGQTDAKGERVLQRPVYPWDLSASMYKLLGIDPAGPLPHPHGCVAYVTPVASGKVPSGGLLTEIM
jgi:hypothetical protein